MIPIYNEEAEPLSDLLKKLDEWLEDQGWTSEHLDE